MYELLMIILLIFTSTLIYIKYQQIRNKKIPFVNKQNRRPKRRL